MNLLVSDFDQTYYNSSNISIVDDIIISLNNYTLKSFIQKGNKFMLSTGRSFRSIKFKTTLMGIPFDYLSTNNGNVLYDNKYNMIYQKTFDSSTIQTISNFLDTKNSIVYIQFLNNDFNQTKDPSNIGLISIKFNSKEVLIENKKYLEENINKIKCFSNKNELIITNNPLMKSNTIEIVKHLENICDNNIYSIGDYYNDLDMIKSYNGFATNQAIPIVKNHALKTYRTVFGLVNDINKNKVLKRTLPR